MSVETEFNRYFEKLNDSFDLEDGERENLLSEFRQLVTRNRSDFLTAISDIPATDGELLFHVYDSLSKDSSNWQDFFINELNRLFSAAESAKDPRSVFLGIDGFELLNNENDSDFSKRIRQIIVDKINNSKNARIRRVATWLLGDFIYLGNDYEIQLLGKLKSDSDWRVRYFAYQILNELNGRSLENGIPILDRLRDKLFGVYKSF